MKRSLFKRISAFLLAAVMLLTMVPAGVLAAQEELPVIMKFTAASSGDFHKYFNKVYSVTFLDEIDQAAMNGAIEKWDISANAGSGEVMSWMYLNDEATAAAGSDRYDVYIAGDGGVAANPSSGYIFYLFSELVEVNGSENFITDNATTFISMFENCYKLERVSFKNWNTENVTSMENMFRNCHELTELDLSSFNTSKVTTMRFMFYLCKKLETIYAGDGWTTASLLKLNDGIFNCCYAMFGVTEEEYTEELQNGRQFDASADKATFEEGGYLTYKAPEAPEEYTVTYEFIGSIIPDGVTAPADAVYEEGSTVAVKDAASAEHYIFSGWSTTDAAVENGEFTVNNDVHFVGSWTRIYQVTYKYDESYELPEEAPEIPEAELWFAPGEDVPAYGTPYVPGYVFVGWTSDDAEIIGDEFTMPESDVVFYGYFKIPVESIEIMNNGDVILNEDEQTRLNVYVKPEDATIKDIIYESSNPDVAIVDKYGNIIAVGEGEATITVKSADDETKSDTITVKVKKPVTEIGVTPAEIELDANDEDKRETTITVFINEDATNKEVTFTSDNESVVKVDENGKVTAVGDGETTITVTSKDNPDKFVTVKVNVKTPVKELTASDDFTLELDEAKNVEAEVNGDATNKELIYETSDPGVVKVDSEGNVIAVGEGTATVTVISRDNPEIRKEIEVTVVKKYKVTYEIIGEVRPDGVTAPEAEKYNNGSTVVVEADLYADGYDFSGWVTEDITVTDGSFVIDRDVHFVGAFSKNVTDITVDKKEITLGKGETDRIEVTVTPEDATDTRVTFESSDPEIVEVDSYGNITALKDGTVTITVKSQDNPELTETVTVTVKDSVDKITVDKTEITLDEGAKDKITVTVSPDNATDKSVTYESSDESVVKVDEDGNIEAVGEGEATITVKANDGSEKEVTVKVTVNKPAIPVEEIIITGDSSVELQPGVSYPVSVIVNPSNATNKDISFESSNPDIASVDQKGNVIAHKEGTVTITAISKDDPTKTDTITVTVKKPHIYVESVVVDKNTITMETGDTDKITASVKPDDATNKEVTYKSSNENVVKVDENGNIEAVGEGTAVIRVTSAEKTHIYKEILVVVKPERVPVTDITVSENAVELEEGLTHNLNVTVTPDNATDGDVTYTSSNESVVTVDKDGKITAKSEGTATITITSKSDPDVKETVTVTVKPSKNPGYTIVVPDGININEGESKNLGVTITPDDGTIKPVYTSGDESIVTVDADGNITGIKAGATVINVDFGNGDIRVIPVVVIEVTVIPQKHYVCFGKTDGIGWYEVSVNGGDFFPQGPNSTLEVEEGSVLVVRVQDMWIDDEFDFYVNGSKVPMDPANTITVVVDGYMLIGALSMDVEVPDVDESLTIFERITNFFAKIINWFRDLFTW